MKSQDGAADVLTISDGGQEIERRRAMARRGTYRYDEASDSIVFAPLPAKAPQAPLPMEAPAPPLHTGQYL